MAPQPAPRTVSSKDPLAPGWITLHAVKIAGEARPGPGRLIAVTNVKGGTGKSTVAVNLACALADAGIRVQLVDADPLGTTMAWGRAGKLPVTPRDLPLAEGSEIASWLRRLRALLVHPGVVVLDLPPRLTPVILLADLAVVPLTTSDVDMMATKKILEFMRDPPPVLADRRPPCVLLPSKVDRRTGAGRRVDTMLEQLGMHIGPAIMQRTAHIDAFRKGAWIGAVAPGSAAHEEFRSLAQQVIGLLELPKSAEIAVPTPPAGQRAPEADGGESGPSGSESQAACA